MTKAKIIGTGLSGLVGSRIVELLSSHYEFEDISRKTGTDISDKEALRKRLQNSQAEVVIHLAAKTNVDACEEDKPMGENGEAWKINVIGTENLIEACEKTGKKLLYISTDFVFDGENTPEGGYTEKDSPHPINWYAQTKYEAEKRVQNASVPWVIVRIAYPYRAAFEKGDFFRAIKNRLSQNLPIAGISDHTFCPTFIDDIAQGVSVLLEKDVTGIFQMTGSQALSPYEASLLIAKKFGYSQELISQTTREEYFKGKAPRPFNLSINNDKIKKLGAVLHDFSEGLDLIKEQLS
ncbi:MAG TPA: SDR family oxidoreductase [Patescibacteria group bacterium]|nr:SDR family oxidoreductase [Patescibacteria group bacterium]